MPPYRVTLNHTVHRILPRTRYKHVIKADDDAVVILPHLGSFIRSLQNQTWLYSGASPGTWSFYTFLYVMSAPLAAACAREIPEKWRTSEWACPRRD